VDVKVAVDVDVNGLRPGGRGPAAPGSVHRLRPGAGCAGVRAPSAAGSRLRRGPWTAGGGGEQYPQGSVSLSPAAGVHRHRPKAGSPDRAEGAFTTPRRRRVHVPRPQAVHVHGHVYGHGLARAEAAALTTVSLLGSMASEASLSRRRGRT
jgi:hypothetical protein